MAMRPRAFGRELQNVFSIFLLSKSAVSFPRFVVSTAYINPKSVNAGVVCSLSCSELRRSRVHHVEASLQKSRTTLLTS